MTCSSGSSCWNVLSSPPHMMLSVALRAPTSPPLTGASMAPMPLAAAAAAISTASDGSEVVKSTTMEPGLR